MQGGFKAAYDCVKAFSETDFTEDLKKIDVPTLILQGDDDQIVPLDDSGRLSAKIVKDATLKVYPGAPHGLCQHHGDGQAQRRPARLPARLSGHAGNHQHRRPGARAPGRRHHPGRPSPPPSAPTSRSAGSCGSR